MRVTVNIARIVNYLNGKDWVEATTISRDLDTPRYNLQHPLRRLTDEGVIERSVASYPVQYRMVPGVTRRPAVRQMIEVARLGKKARR